MTISKIRSAAYAAAVTALVATPALARNHPLSTYNLFVNGDLSSTSEVEGRTVVRGNLGGTASNYGTRLLPTGDFVNVDSLIVGGNTTAQNLNISAGRVRLGGSRGSTNINFNGGGSLIQDATTPTFIASEWSRVVDASNFLRAQPNTGTVNIPVNQPGPVNFNAVPNQNGVAFFTVDAALFSNNNVQQIDINFNGAQSVIINVVGTSVNFTGGNFVGNFTSAFARSRVLWNFHQATSINLGGRAFNGALVAPKASMSFEGVIEGSLFVGGPLKQSGEVHVPTYGGFIPAPGALGLLAAAGLVAARRRR